MRHFLGNLGPVAARMLQHSCQQPILLLSSDPSSPSTHAASEMAITERADLDPTVPQVSTERGAVWG